MSGFFTKKELLYLLLLSPYWITKAMLFKLWRKIWEKSKNGEGK